MKLLNRLNKLITADAHAVLDSIEEPHALLKQAIRDMSCAIEENECSLKQVNKHLVRLKQQSERLSQEKEKLNQDLDLCFENDNDDLARAVVKKKLYLGQRIELNQQNIQQTKDKQTQLTAQLAANQAEFQVISQQAEILLAQTISARKSEEMNGHLKVNQVIAKEDIEMALLNEKAQREAS